MNRPIKFRAWDGKEMVSLDGIWGHQSNYKYQALMQFTGLTDKNGKEIYEGDIVRYKVFERFHEEERDKTGKVEYVVGKSVGFTPMVYHTEVEDGYYNYEIEDIEVIGNVFQDEHLLQK